MVRRNWVVTGYNSFEKIYEAEFRRSDFTEHQMRVFLQRLVCKTLSFDEIANFSRKRRRNEDHGDLEVHAEMSEHRYTVRVGSNPYFTAQSVEVA